MAENNGTLKWAIGIGVSVGVTVMVITASIATSSYQSLSGKLDTALDKINDNTVAITRIDGEGNNLAWRMKTMEDRVCEIDREN